MLKNGVIKPHQIIISSLTRNEMCNTANASKLYAAQICIHSVNKKRDKIKLGKKVNIHVQSCNTGEEHDI